MQNRSGSIGKPQTVKVRPMLRPERIHQTSSFQCRQSRVFMQIQRAALHTRIPALVTFIHGDLRAALLQQTSQRQPTRSPANNGDPLSFNGIHANLQIGNATHFVSRTTTNSFVHPRIRPLTLCKRREFFFESSVGRSCICLPQSLQWLRRRGVR